MTKDMRQHPSFVGHLRRKNVRLPAGPAGAASCVCPQPAPCGIVWKASRSVSLHCDRKPECRAVFLCRPLSGRPSRPWRTEGVMQGGRSGKACGSIQEREEEERAGTDEEAGGKTGKALQEGCAGTSGPGSDGAGGADSGVTCQHVHADRASIDPLAHARVDRNALHAHDDA